MEPAAVLVTGICELFDMYLLAVFRSFSDQPLASFIPGEGVQVLSIACRCWNKFAADLLQFARLNDCLQQKPALCHC